MKGNVGQLVVCLRFYDDSILEVRWTVGYLASLLVVDINHGDFGRHRGSFKGSQAIALKVV